MSAPTPTDRRYTKSHEWVRTDGDELVVGITEHAQSELTDIVFVELPKVGRQVTKGESVLVLESVKTVADVYAPGAGTLTGANDELKTQPQLINQDPYGKGWLFRLKSSGAPEPAETLDAPGYDAFILAGASAP